MNGEEQKAFFQDDFNMGKKDAGQVGRNTIGRGKMLEQVAEPVIE